MFLNKKKIGKKHLKLQDMRDTIYSQMVKYEKYESEEKVKRRRKRLNHSGLI